MRGVTIYYTFYLILLIFGTLETLPINFLTI